jgi:hypothetical protein
VQGGGVYITEWLDRKISIWFFHHGEEPKDYLEGKPDPSGVPKGGGKANSMSPLPCIFQ